MGSDSEFLSHHEREEIYFARCDGKEAARGLLPFDEVDRLITAAPMRPDTFRVVAGGREVPESMYSRVRNGVRLIDPESVLRYFRQGSTVVVNHVEWWTDSIANTCRALEDEFQLEVSCNLFVTPAAVAGLKPHWDAQDTIMLQVAGQKHWDLWKPLHPHTSGAQVIEGSKLGSPCRTITLELGSILYVPRGWIHAPYTTDHMSAHLAFIVERSTWLDALMHDARRLAHFANDTLRRSLPLRYSRAGDGLEAAEAMAAVVTLLGGLDVQKALTSYQQTQYSRSPLSRRGHLLQYLAADGTGDLADGSLDGSRWLGLTANPSARVKLGPASATSRAVNVNGSQFEVPPAVADFIEDLFARGQTLPCHQAAKLLDKGTLSELIEMGVVSLVDMESTSA
jgi:hypothetical protein